MVWHGLCPPIQAAGHTGGLARRAGKRASEVETYGWPRAVLVLGEGVWFNFQKGPESYSEEPHEPALMSSACVHWFEIQ